MPFGDKNYYQILQVDPSAEPEIIAVAYKRLALKYHPDTNSSPDATPRMQAINKAYEVLKTPDIRAQYDETLSPQPPPPPPKDLDRIISRTRVSSVKDALYRIIKEMRQRGVKIHPWRARA